MHEKVESEMTGKPASGIGRWGGGMNKILTPLSTWAAYLGAAVLGLLVLMLMYSIIARRAFNAPLKGSMELTELALGLITFCLLAYDSLRGESMIVEIIIERLPRRFQAVTAVVIHFLSTSILGILCWQLIVQGTRVYNFHQTTVILSIPVYPFLFIAALGIFLLALVYLMHCVNSIDKLGRR
jgi:TRAP-type transport system small permease protein